MMMSPQRFMLWSLVVGLLLCSSGGSNVMEQEDVILQEERPEERRQLWDFWSILNLGTFWMILLEAFKLIS